MKDKKAFYKKWWVWLIAILIIAAAANGANNAKPEKVGSSDNVTAASNSSESKTPETFKIGDKVKLGDYILIINEAGVCTSKNQFIKPQEGKKFITVDITQENNGKEPHDYNLWYFKLQDDKDFSYTTSISSCKDPMFGSGTLQSGQKTRGFITFEIPAENNPTQLKFTPSWWSQGEISIELK